MKTIIAGSRAVTNYVELLKAVAACGWQITGVVSGCALGADRLGEQYAAERGLAVYRFPAQWDTHGKSAGYRRNAEMAENAEALIALWDGKSRGTKHMIELAYKQGLRIFVLEVKI